MLALVIVDALLSVIFLISAMFWVTSRVPRYLPALSRTAKYRMWTSISFMGIQNSATSLRPLLKSSRICSTPPMLEGGWQSCTLRPMAALERSKMRSGPWGEEGNLILVIHERDVHGQMAEE